MIQQTKKWASKIFNVGQFQIKSQVYPNQYVFSKFYEQGIEK